MGNKKATGFLCLRLVPCFAYVGAEDNRKGIPFVKIVSLLCKLIQFLMVALSVTVHKALILLVFLNHPYQSLAFLSFFCFPAKDLFVKVILEQFLHKLVPVDTADERSGIVVIGDVSRILRENVADDLIYGVVSLHHEGVIHGR